MQYSTNLTDYKTRQDLWKDISRSYPARPTDIYNTMVSDNYNINTWGEVLEIRSTDLGHQSRYERMERIKIKLSEDEQKARGAINDLERQYEKAQSDIDISNIELEEIEKILKEMESDEFFRIKIIKDKNLQIEHDDLRNKKQEISRKIEDSKILISSVPEQVDIIDKTYTARKDILQDALLRDQISAEIIEKRLDSLYKQREQYEKQLTTLDKRGTNGKNPGPKKTKNKKEEEDDFEYEAPEFLSNSKITQKLVERHKDTINFIKDRGLYQQDTKIALQKRSVGLELLRLKTEISRIEKEITSIGKRKERVYLTRSFDDNGDRKGDFVCYTRIFDSTKGNVESEMSHTPRVRVDPKEAGKVLNWLLYAMMLLNMFFFVQTLVGIIPNLVNWHSFYITILTGMVLYQNIKVQNKDKIFEAFYFWLDHSLIDIQYYDEEGLIQSIKVRAYHNRLLYSDKQNLADFFGTSEADILAQSDASLIAKVERYQTELSQKELETISFKQEIKMTTQLNQDLAAKGDKAVAIAWGQLKEEMNFREKSAPTKSTPIAMEIIKYLGVVLIILVAGNVLGDIIPNVISIGGGDGTSLGQNTAVVFTIGLILGFFISMYMNRWQKNL